MRYMAKLCVSIAAAAWLLACGCQVHPGHPPQSLGELRRWQEGGGQEFTRRTIVLHNAKRVLLEELPADKRVESLRVVEKLGATEGQTFAALAGGLSQPSTPQSVRLAVLAYLAKQGYPGLAEHVVAALPHADDPKLRSSILAWLEENPSPNVLAEIVKLWAADASPNEQDELRYRRVVARISGRKWEDALLTALNGEDTFPRGSTIEVLAARLTEDRLRERIAALRPQTQAVRSMQHFLQTFGYLPRTRKELRATVVAHARGAGRLTAAAALANRWQQRYGYRFNVRDIHLLGHLASDPLRNLLLRRQLKLELSQIIAARRRNTPAGLLGRTSKFRGGVLVDFDSQVEILSMVDLWNLALVNEMMSRLRYRMALKIVIRRDREDVQTQWGGLISYEQGKAEAKLYRPGEKTGDDAYVPSQRFHNDAIDCMCFFVAHFARGYRDAAGPTKEELAFSKKQNLYGLAMTSLGGNRVNATYFNPQ